MAILALSFDLDDTLWDTGPCIDRAEERLHAWLQPRYPRIVERYSPRQLRALCEEAARLDPSIAHDRGLMRKRALTMAAAAADYAQFALDEAFEVFFAARNEVLFFDDTLPVLERLHRRYRFAALSNGNADLKRIGIAHLFDLHLSAVDVGMLKPHPAMFELAAQRLELSPGQILHVGDEPDHDVRGAAAAGFRTVWVNRSGRPWPGAAPADAEIADLNELEALLLDERFAR
ncbi:HAD family hydrolase [Plasticicumulans acidivorans]|uniref:Putative hydrolase of the HAD superfamily n=1 Tax=Plasticicumulans acidivorans TaxID=886464 RepID=A0A317MSX0_9GAMM|nr:HAD family hydrolase [Plasticicumulans acidivorans]PWV60244.1 putative hydrolase of the HAD superfamily [Plasticicumulans acidivorans]